MDTANGFRYHTERIRNILQHLCIIVILKLRFFTPNDASTLQ